jgi:hypothetical protein
MAFGQLFHTTIECKHTAAGYFDSTAQSGRFSSSARHRGAATGPLHRRRGDRVILSQCGKRRSQSVAMGQKQTWRQLCAMSAMPPIATKLLHRGDRARWRSERGAGPLRAQLVAQQFQQLHPKSIGNSGHDQQTRVSPAALNSTHVGQIDFSFERQLLLCQLSLLTIFANILAEYDAPIPHCRIGPYGVYCL